MAITESIDKMIEDHMGAQPYEISCSDCGNPLTVHNTKIDGDMDLHISVDPCETCMAEAGEDNPNLVEMMRKEILRLKAEVGEDAA